MSSSRALLALAGLAALVLLLVLWPSDDLSSAALSAPAEPLREEHRPSRSLEPELAVAPALRTDSKVATAAQADESRRDTPSAAVRGRCVELGSGAPVLGVEVHLVVWGQEPSATTTGQGGAFAFPSPGNTVSWVEVRRPAAWIAERARLRLSPEQRVGADEVVMELEVAATVVGRVVDAASGEPVPHVTVSLSEKEGYSDHITTGGDGTFLSTGRVRERPLDVSVRDGRGYLSVVEGEQTAISVVRSGYGSTPIELAVSIGPTYYLRAVAQKPVASRHLRARIVQTAPDGGEVAWTWLRPRGDDGPPWIRYDERPREALATGEARLELRSTEGSLAGATPVLTTVGVHPGVVEVELRPASRVRGRVVDTAGSPVAEARVHLAPLAGGRPDRDASRWIVGRSSSRGDFTLESAFPGRYRLVVDAAGAPPFERDLDVTAGPLDLGDLRLERVAAGDVWALLNFDESRGPLRAYGRLTPARGAGPARSVEPEIDGEDNGPVGGVFFSDVPDGAYELEIVATDHHRWSPARIAVTPPMSDLVFTRIESEPGLSLGFRPTDAETGRPIPGFDVRMSIGETWEPVGQGWLWGETRGPLPASRPLHWTLTAGGYRAVHGTERSFTTPGDDVRTRFASPALERGWGARIHVRDATGFHATVRTDPWTYRSEALARPALAGVVVLADGEPVGTTDASGRVDIALDAEPRRIELVHPGWRVLDSPFLRGGELSSDEREGIVWMQRD